MATTKKKFSLEKLKKTDQLVVRTGKDQNIDRVIFPNPVEIGLDSDTLRSALTSHGGVKLPTGRPSDTQNVLYNDGGILKFNGDQVVADSNGIVTLTRLGVTGSIDIKGPLRVTGGIVTDDANSEFIRAGDRIQVSKNSDGSFTITADVQSGAGSGGSSDPQYLTLANSSDLNNERVFSAGTGLNVNDGGAGGNFTVSVDTTKIPQLDQANTFASDVKVQGKIEGSIQKLSDGTTDYIQAGSNVSVTNNSNGSISISSTDTNTTYSAGNGISLTGTTFSINLQTGGGLQLTGAKVSVDPSDFAGDGLKVSSGNLVVEPSNFAGTGLEDDGSDNLRISTSAAGNGLSGGGGSALSVTADSTTGGNVTPVSVSGNGVGLDVSTIAGSGVSADGSGNLKLDINNIGGTALTTGADSDLVAIADSDGSNVTKKMALSDLKTYITAGSTAFNAGDGLQLDSDTFRQRAVLTVSEAAGVFKIDGQAQPIISAPKTLNFFFDLSHNSLSGNVFRLSTTPDGTHGGGSEFTNGVTTSGTPGSSGAYLEVKFTQEDPSVLYYYDANGSGRGGKLITGMGYLETDTATVTYAGKGKFPQGIEGSIQKLSDGTTDYIQGGNNITVTNNANGSITIDSDVAGAFTAGDGIEISNSVISTDLKAGSGLKITSGEVDLDNAIVAKLAGATFTGNVTVPGAGGIRGSIQKLSDGTTDYIQAGDNVTVTNNANGSITISSTAGGGGGGGSGTIGAAEDGDYTDGLFSDFTTGTNVGTAVDRFNEVLKALAPDPAPNLTTISAITSGVTCKLSFDGTITVAGYTPVEASAGLGAAVNTNGLYTPTNNSGNIRIGAVTSGTVITGVVAAGVTANTFAGGVVNYPANSLGSADQGVLRLTVNGLLRKSVTLSDSTVGSGSPGAGTGSELEEGSGFINISDASSGKFSNGSSFDVFKHRTLNFQIAAAHQRTGWNYVQISHTIGSTTHTTNFIEWVVDETKDSGGTSEPLGVSGQSLASLNMAGTRHISGVEYNTGGSATYTVTVNNAYKDVYSNGNITFSGTSCSAPSQSFPAIGGSEDSSKSLSLTATATINDTKMLNEEMALSVNVPHPIRANLAGAGSASISGLLVYNVNENSTVLIENFNGETYRLQTGAYSNQSDISSKTWNSTSSIIAGGLIGHVNGLLVYDNKLVSPTSGLNGGDFRKTSEGGNILNGPAGNVNYSSTVGTKQYFRRFTNNSGGSKTNFNLSMNMAGTTVVLSDGTINNANITVAVKLPQTPTGFGTAWLDIKKPFATGQVGTDGDGCLVGDFDSASNSTNQCTFGTQSAGNGEYIILRVTANSNWSGSISQISVSWL